MNTKNLGKTIGIHFLLVIFIYGAVLSPALSAIVSSDELLSSYQATEKRTELAQLFDRADVQQELTKRGVDPALAKSRIVGMTDAEISKLTQDLEKLPAGQGVLGVIVLVLVILLLTEILGYTDVSDKV